MTKEIPELRLLKANASIQPLDDNASGANGTPNWTYNTCEALMYLQWALDNTEAALKSLREKDERSFDNSSNQGYITPDLDLLEEGFEKLKSGYNQVCRIPTCSSWPKIPENKHGSCSL